jgi:hypothetical protein
LTGRNRRFAGMIRQNGHCGPTGSLVKHDGCGRRRHFAEQDSLIVRVVLGCGVPAIFQLRANAGRSTWTGSSKAALLRGSAFVGLRVQCGFLPVSQRLSSVLPRAYRASSGLVPGHIPRFVPMVRHELCVSVAASTQRRRGADQPATRFSERRSRRGSARFLG